MLFKELNRVGFSRSESSILAFTEKTQEAFAGEIAKQHGASEVPETYLKTSIHAFAFRDPDGRANVWYEHSVEVVGYEDEKIAVPIPEALRASRSPVSVVLNLGVIASDVIEALEKIG